MDKIFVVKGDGWHGHSGRAFYRKDILTWCGSEGNLAMKPVDMSKVTSIRPQTDDDIKLLMKWATNSKRYS